MPETITISFTTGDDTFARELPVALFLHLLQRSPRKLTHDEVALLLAFQSWFYQHIG